MKIEDYFKNGKIIVWKEKFAVVKSNKAFSGAFAIINDKKEVTSVVDE